MKENEDFKKEFEKFRKALLLLMIQANWESEQIISYLGCTDEEINFLRLIK